MRGKVPRHLVAAAVAAAMLAPVTACSAESGDGDRGTNVLTVGGWGGRFTASTQEFLAKPFTEETGIKVQFVDAPGEQVARLRAMREAGRIEWDLVEALDASSAAVAYHEGLAADMPAEIRQRLEEILPADRITEHGIYFANNAFVIGCNRDVAKACPTTAAEFFDVERFPGPRAIIDRPLIALTFALAADGVDIAKADGVDFDRAFAKLETIKDHVRVWYSAGDQMEQIVRDGQVAMGLLWSGRSYGLISQGVNLQVSWDGAIYDPGEWFVVKGAPNEKAAWEFIVSLAANAEGQAKWSTEMAYGLANPDAFKHMDPAVAETLPDWPANFEKAIIPDHAFYAANVKEFERRWIEFLGR